MEFTGERYIDESNGLAISIEHTHRYKSILSVTKDKVVLDAACGSGYGSWLIAENATKVYGIDISSDSIEYARNNHRNENIEFIQSSIESIPLEDNCIDVVVSFETIEHVNINCQKKFLSEINRVLKKDGILIISTPNKLLYSDIPNFNNPYHIKEFYIDEFIKFVSSYFKYYQIYHQSFHLTSIIRMHNEKNIKILNNEDNDGMYIVVICSNKKIEEKIGSGILGIQNFYEKSDNKLYHLINQFDNIRGKIYLDYGNGFTEDNSFLLPYNHNDDDIYVLKMEIDISKNIKKLRWDPLEGHLCRCKIIKVDTDGVYKGIKTDNSWRKSDGWDEFFTTDPMYEFDGNFQEASYLTIYFIIEIINPNEVMELLNHTMQLLEMKKTKNTNLIQEIEMKKTENTNLIQEIEMKKTENTNLIQEIEMKKTENTNLIQQIEMKEKENSNLIQEIAMKQTENANLTQEIVAEKAKNENLLNEIDNERQQKEQILSSTSWKITKPLRKVKDMINK